MQKSSHHWWRAYFAICNIDCRNYFCRYFFKTIAVHISCHTVVRRIGVIAENVQCRLFSKFGGKLFSIQLDEARDSNGNSHLIP